MQTARCNGLIAQAREYERWPKTQYHAEGGGESEAWYETIHRHFEEVLLPEIKQRGGELFVEYWPAKFVVDREHELRQGVSAEILYNYQFGSHGTGYVCVTSRSIYLVILDKLTKQFPLYKASLTGFLLDALAKQMNRLQPYQRDYSWTLTPAQIQAVSIASGRSETERIKLVSTAGIWELFEHFTDQRKEMLDAIECLRGGAFNNLRPKWHVTKRPPILSEAQVMRQASKVPSFSLLPATPDAMRAERGMQLADLHLLAAEVARGGGAEVELDLAHAAAKHPGNTQLQELRRVFTGMRHLLDRCKTETEVLDTLLVRIDRIAELADIYRKCVARVEGPYFKSWHPLPDSPHPALVRTIEIGELHNPTGQGDSILVWTWGKDSTSIITGGNDGVVRIWDLFSATITHSFEAFSSAGGGPPDYKKTHWIVDLAISPDFKTLLTVSNGEGIKAWNTDDWSLQYVIDVEMRGTFFCEFDSFGNLLAFGDEISKQIAIWDARARQPIRHNLDFNDFKREDDSVLASYRLGPSGDWILALIAESEWTRQRLAAISIASGEELFSIRVFDNHGFRISPTGSHIVVRGGSRDNLRFWDVAAGDWGHEIDGLSVSSWNFSPSGKYVACGRADDSIVVYEVHSGVPVHTLLGHWERISDLQFSHDERFLMSCDASHQMKLWDLTKASASFATPKHFLSDDIKRARACVVCKVIPADKTVLVLNPDHHDAGIIDSGTGEISPRHTDMTWVTWVKDMKLSQLQTVGIDRCAVTPDGKYVLLTDNGGWAVFDSKTMSVLDSTNGDFSTQGACAVSSDKRWVAASSGKLLEVWDLITGDIHQTKAGGFITSCAFDPASQRLIYADIDTGMNIVNLGTKQTLSFSDPSLESSWDKPYNCTFTPDGTLVLAAHRHGAMSIWDATTLALVRHWKAHVTGYPTRIACRGMENNKAVLTVASDRAIRLWDIGSGKCICCVQTDCALDDCDIFLGTGNVVAASPAGLFWLSVVGI